MDELLPQLACPECLSSLSVEHEPGRGDAGPVLACEAEGHRFPVREGIPLLIRAEREASVEAFESAYTDVWRREGWGGADPAYLLALPWKDVTGRQSGKWRVKARSLKALRAFLAEVRPGTVADLGAGVGWLAHHLAEWGYQVYAVDVLVDEALGLGAARTYLEHGRPFQRVRGEIERPPLRDGSMDVVLYNASLHYSRSIESALQEAHRIVRSGGWVVVMNSPVHRDAQSAARAQRDYRSHLRDLGAPSTVAKRYRHFTRDRLLQILRQEVGPIKVPAFDPGWGFRLVRWGKGLVLGMELASFPMLAAHKA